MDLHDMDDIRANGFEGFVSIRELQVSVCCDVPSVAGVYMVVRPSSEAPIFLSQGTGCRKYSNPKVGDLKKKWVEGAVVLNIGKAGGPSIKETLRKRLKKYMRFGQEKNSGHSGGRRIWQLRDSGDLLVCWKRTPGLVPRLIEKAIIADFKQQHDARRPFANLSD